MRFAIEHAIRHTIATKDAAFAARLPAVPLMARRASMSSWSELEAISGLSRPPVLLERGEQWPEQDWMADTSPAAGQLPFPADVTKYPGRCIGKLVSDHGHAPRR